MTLGNSVRLAASPFCHLENERTGNVMDYKIPEAETVCVPVQLRKEKQERGQEKGVWKAQHRE